MYKLLRRITIVTAGFLIMTIGNAQDSLKKEKPQMADLMRSNGKIYVVVSVVLIILTGLFIYLVQLDRKISRLEKNIK